MTNLLYHEYPAKISVNAKYKEIEKTLKSIFEIEENRINGVVYRFDALVSDESQKFNSYVLLQLENQFPEYVFHYLGDNRIYIIERVALKERGRENGTSDKEEKPKHKAYAVRT